MPDWDRFARLLPVKPVNQEQNVKNETRAITRTQIISYEIEKHQVFKPLYSKYIILKIWCLVGNICVKVHVWANAHHHRWPTYSADNFDNSLTKCWNTVQWMTTQYNRLARHRFGTQFDRGQKVNMTEISAKPTKEAFWPPCCWYVSEGTLTFQMK